MNTHLSNARPILIALFFLLIAQGTSTAQSNLRFVTWNVEHLAENNGEGCVARYDEDYAVLKEFAATLGADVVALQEVESVKAVARVFPEDEWDIIVSDRPNSGSYDCRGSGRPSTQQKVAIVVRKGIAFEKIPSFKELAVGNPGLRYGVIVRLTGTPEPIDVLAVHLKSGCFVDDYARSNSNACESFEEQAPVLDGWIEAKVANKEAFVIMGDFNHRLANEGNVFWEELTEMNGEPVKLSNSMATLRGCHQRYPAPIDHVLVGPAASRYYVSGSEDVHFFGKNRETMTEEDMLSDHCPVSVQLSFTESFPVSSGVQWAQKSAEYKLITSFLYQQGAENIKKYQGNSNPWVVYMDVDETLLDNSHYNKRRDAAGLGFSSESWAEWVKEEAATEVPGAKGFVEEVLKAGGQIALITNRDRALDQHTWNNLQKLGFPINRENTCIIGRADSDKQAVGQAGIINDKDLRRQNVAAGMAESCWAEYPEAKSFWNRKLFMVMQVGDNIQDFAKTTQENVNISDFLKRQGKDILVLPNAMYGSWD